jgi:hypothetical protein
MSARGGASLAELLVSLTILALGGAMSGRVLSDATLIMEEADLGLRAALFLSELRDGRREAVQEQREAGPGVLIAEGAGAGAAVRFEPPDGAIAPRSGPGGYRRARRWSVAGEGVAP